MNEQKEKNPRDWEPGQTIGKRYQLIDFMGAGAFGQVWKAMDIPNSKPQALHVALKLLQVSLSSDQKRTLENYQKVYSLYHPNIAAYTDLFIDGDTGILVMEFVDGQTLAKYRGGKHGKIALEAVLSIARQIAAGLDFAHEKGLVHRDIHLENVMIKDEKGKKTVKILDFGEAEMRESMPWNNQGVNSYSPYYTAPEQVMNRSPQSESDQYALASLVYDLISGRAPSNVSPEPLRELTEFQNRALLKALAKEPTERFKSCADFVAALEPESKAVHGWLQLQGIRVGSKNERGFTLMHFAAKDGRVDVLDWLKIQGENVNAKDNDDKTPIFNAVLVDRVDAIDWLIAQGCDVNAKANDGGTPMHYAAGRGHFRSMERLKMQGADINAEDDNGQTPIFRATAVGRVDAMIWLKTNGANISAVDKHGRTPTFLAANNIVTQWLVENGADIHAKGQ